MDKQRFDWIFYEELRAKEVGLPVSTCMIAQMAEELWKVIEVIQEIGAKTILEIGVASGGTSRFWTEIAGPDGKVVGLDAAGDGRASLGYPLPSNYNPVIGDSHAAESLAKVQELFSNQRIDFLFIDGDHSYEGVKQDFEMYSPLVRPGGVIALQDVNHDIRLNDFVWKFWNEINLPNKQYHNYGLGMGIIRV